VRLGLKQNQHSPDTVCGYEVWGNEGEELQDIPHKTHDWAYIVGALVLLHALYVWSEHISLRGVFVSGELVTYSEGCHDCCLDGGELVRSVAAGKPAQRPEGIEKACAIGDLDTSGL
jgi:hypothetical protein